MFLLWSLSCFDTTSLLLITWSEYGHSGSPSSFHVSGCSKISDVLGVVFPTLSVTQWSLYGWIFYLVCSYEKSVTKSTIFSKHSENNLFCLKNVGEVKLSGFPIEAEGFQSQNLKSLTLDPCVFNRFCCVELSLLMPLCLWQDIHL